MGKEKRKTRLDKGTGATPDFIGFGAFTGTSGTNSSSSSSAVVSPTTAAAQSATGTATTTTPPSSSNNKLSWSPVYTGSDDRDLQMTFARIRQKKDAITKVKALQTLEAYFASLDSDKPSKVQAARHWIWLYHNAIVYDTAPTVRSQALRVWKTIIASANIPKALSTLLHEGEDAQVLGMLYVAANADAEIKTQLSKSEYQDLQQTLEQQSDWDWQRGILSYTSRILSFGRPSAMHQALFAVKKTTANANNSSSSSSSKSGSGSGSKQEKASSSSNDLSEAQKDALEERFEKITGNALDALSLWLGSEQCTLFDDDSESSDSSNGDDDVSTLWLKTLTTQKASLRRRTYHLVAVWATTLASKQKTDSPCKLMLPENIHSRLSQAMAVEKEAFNWPALLEAVLAATKASTTTSTTKSDDATADHMDTLNPLYIKPLIKSLKRALHGASVAAWGPMLLPTCALVQDPLPLLQATWQGRTLTCGMADKWLLYQAVAEACVYSLVRTSSTSTTPLSHECAQGIAQLWLETLQETLEVDPTTLLGKSRSVHSQLVSELARQLRRLEQASSSSAVSTSSSILGQSSELQIWFWSNLSFATSHAAALASFVDSLPPSKDNEASSSSSSVLDEKWRDSFARELTRYQTSSGQVPTIASYQLLTSLLQHVGPERLFNATDESSKMTLERFVMNDLLRWIVIHTSTLSQGQHEQSKALVEYDFGLLRTCFDRDEEENSNDANATTPRSLWEPLLREVVKAQCDLDWLVMGILVLLSSSTSSSSSSSQSSSTSATDWIPCPTLDRLAIQVGQESMDDCMATAQSHHHHEHDDESLHSVESGTQAHAEEYDRRLHFMQTCVGLFPGSRKQQKRLVGEQVISAWIDMAYESLKPPLSTRISPLLQLLITMVDVKDNIPGLLHSKATQQQQEQQVEQILLGSWKYVSSHLYTDSLLPLLVDCCDSKLRARFVTLTCDRLKEEFSALTNDTSHSISLSSSFSSIAVVWADRAWRIMQACPKAVHIDDDNTPSVAPRPSLALFGLSDTELWRTHTQSMFLATMCLMKRIDSPSDRFQLLRASSDADGTELILSILSTLSEAGIDVLETARVCKGKDGAALFLSALGGCDLNCKDVERWIRVLVSKTADSLADPNEEQTVQRSVAVLSLLIGVSYPRIVPGLSPSEIKEGDQLYYITNPNVPSVREEATIVKVHYDSQAGYYFSILVNRIGGDANSQMERQTVVGRLRRERVDPLSLPKTVAVEDISSNEWAERKRISELLISKLVLPFFAVSPWRTCISEVVNIVVSQLGLGTDRGLGSAHYEVFKVLSNEDGVLRKALDSRDWTASEACQWKLALALGFGLNTARTTWSFQDLSLDPHPSYQSLLELYRGSNEESESSTTGLEIGAQPQLDDAVLAWLCVSLPAVKWTAESQGDLIQILTLLFQLASDCLSEFTGAAMVAVRAIYSGLALIQTRPSDLQSDEDGGEEENKLVGAQSEAIGQLIRAFAFTWDTKSSGDDSNACSLLDDEEPEPTWRAASSFQLLLGLASENVEIKDLFRSSIRSDAMEGLSKALFDESKRYFAFQLLGLVAEQRDTPLREAGDVVLGKSTKANLEGWKEGLDPDEASELEEDVEVVSQWLPLHMMESVEALKEHSFDEELDETETIGRFLMWLSVLRFIDAAAPVDYCNRPAFVSYLTRAEAVGTVLNTALLFEESINTAKGQRSTSSPMIHVTSLLEDESKLSLSNLASLVLFRTVEVLPSLCRRWWEEDCPKVYVAPVQSFLEEHIAPEILRLELDRISKTSSFGEMNVSGSLVSREVTATVVQDDFTLSVLIRLPPAFPLRSAEVDCSKTFGVPPTRWKRWSLQIKLMLNNQGGTLKDALLLWKDNVDCEFEGVEPCPVCYSVLHVKTHKLPVLECLTCNNRFHVDCLTQWFKSSGKSQCVLCQQDWKGTRVG